jgi:hypothetical protein
MKDIDPNRAYMKYQDIWATFDLGSGALKMAICNKKSLSLSVFKKICFCPLKNRSTGSPGPYNWAKSLKNSVIKNWNFGKCYVKILFLPFLHTIWKIMKKTSIFRPKIGPIRGHFKIFEIFHSGMAKIGIHDSFMN